MGKVPTVEELFDLEHTIARRLIESSHYGHRAIAGLKEFIKSIIPTLGPDFEEIGKDVYASKDAVISDSAEIIGPTIICRKAEIRPGAYIRGSVIIGCGAVIGNSTEVKNSIIFDEAKLPHYNYAGDSIIGYKAHMGAGAIASNQRLDKRPIRLKSEEEVIETGMTKLGAMLGDYAEIGCHSVLSPGTIIGRESLIYPLSHIRGTVERGLIIDGGREKRYRK